MKKILDTLIGSAVESHHKEEMKKETTKTTTSTMGTSPLAATTTSTATTGLLDKQQGEVCGLPPTASSVTAATLDAGTVEKPPVLQETIKPVGREEVQPVIHRLREQTEIHEATQPVFEQHVKPTQYHAAELPALTTAEQREDITKATEEYKAATTMHQPSVQVLEGETTKVVREPIVQETIKKTVVTEVQPVIHRTTIEPHVIVETQPVYEKVVEAPKIITEQRPAAVITEPIPSTEPTRTAPVVAGATCISTLSSNVVAPAVAAPPPGAGLLKTVESMETKKKAEKVKIDTPELIQPKTRDIVTVTTLEEGPTTKEP